MLKILCKYLIFISFVFSNIYADDLEVENLLEKAHQASTMEQKKIFIEKLKSKLAKVNQKAREESDAIIDAKKKIPTKLFNGEK